MSSAQEVPQQAALSPSRLETGPYILRSLIQDVALSADGADDVRITCVEVWGMELVCRVGY